MLAMVGWVLSYGFAFLVSIPINGLLISATWSWFVAKFDAGDATEPGQIAAAVLGKIIGVGVIGPLLTLVIAWAWHAFVLAPNSN